MDQQEWRLFHAECQRRQKRLSVRGQPTPGPQAGTRSVGVESSQVYLPQHTEVVIAAHADMGIALDKADALLRMRAIANDVSEDPQLIESSAARGISQYSLKRTRVGVQVRRQEAPTHYRHCTTLHPFPFE